MAAQRFAVPEKPLLVVGAIGREVVRALLEQGARVRVFVRSPEKAVALPGAVERVIGTLEDRRAVAQAIRDVHAVSFISPHDDAEEQIAENSVSACEDGFSAGQAAPQPCRGCA